MLAWMTHHYSAAELLRQCHAWLCTVTTPSCCSPCGCLGNGSSRSRPGCAVWHCSLKAWSQALCKLSCTTASQSSLAHWTAVIESCNLVSSAAPSSLGTTVLVGLECLLLAALPESLCLLQRFCCKASLQLTQACFRLQIQSQHWHL